MTTVRGCDITSPAGADNVGSRRFWYPLRVDLEGAFRRRLRELIQRKYRSLDRFYLETDFSKGHLSNILRGKGSPTLATVTKIARALEVDAKQLFLQPDKSSRDRVIELVLEAKPEVLRRVSRILQNPEEK